MTSGSVFGGLTKASGRLHQFPQHFVGLREAIVVLLGDLAGARLVEVAYSLFQRLEISDQAV